jgi:hypothetical protein
MENRSNILIELKSISPALAEIVPVNPYTIPEGYFENLASEVLLIVTEEKPSGILGKIIQAPYEVPSNYFHKLPEQLVALVKSDEVSSVLPGKANNPYRVPQGYFNDLAGNILKRVKVEDHLSAKEELESLSPLLSTLDKKIPFSTPVDYFEDLTGNVLGGVKAIDDVNEELKNLSPVVASLKTADVYEAPTGYFDNFPALMLDKTKQHQPARVVSMTFRKKVLRYAAAAVVTGMILTAGFLFINRQSSTVAPGALAEAEEIIERETQTNVEGLSDDELVNFLDNQTAPLPDVLSAAATAEIDSEDVKIMLADIPDADLKQYLVEYSDGKEVLTN